MQVLSQGVSQGLLEARARFGAQDRNRGLPADGFAALRTLAGLWTRWQPDVSQGRAGGEQGKCDE